MTIYRYIPLGDVDLVTGSDGLARVVMVQGVDYVRQKISTRLKFFLGEWFLDLRQGVPYYRDVFVKNPNLTIVRAIFRDVILSVQEVLTVDTITLDYNSKLRLLAVQFTATLVDGGVLVVKQPDPPFIIAVTRPAA